MSDKKPNVTLEMTHDQAAYVESACEAVARILLGQYHVAFETIFGGIVQYEQGQLIRREVEKHVPAAKQLDQHRDEREALLNVYLCLRQYQCWQFDGYLDTSDRRAWGATTSPPRVVGVEMAHVYDLDHRIQSAITEWIGDGWDKKPSAEDARTAWDFAKLDLGWDAIPSCGKAELRRHPVIDGAWQVVIHEPHEPRRKVKKEEAK